MNCQECQDALIDYHYRELGEAPRRAVAAHLCDCSSCAVAYVRLDAELSGLTASLSERPRPEVRRALEARVARAFPRRLWPRLAGIFTRRVALYQPILVAALVLIVWLMAGVLRGTPAHKATNTIDGYDGRTLLTVDPSVL